MRRDTSLLIGHQYLIEILDQSRWNGIQRRLLEMGFVRGEWVQIEKLAPLGDPMELVIKGYHMSLRRSEGACIFVEMEA